jgi:uncharacterized membrane protein YkoI
MKKILFLLMLASGYCLTAFAQKTPPQAVVAAFNQKFPGVAKADWDKEKNGAWEAEFEQNDVDMSANFSADGKWLETETEIKLTELPASVQAALAGKKVKEAARIQRADGSTVYEAEVKRKDLLFDAAGKMLQESKD